MWYDVLKVVHVLSVVVWIGGTVALTTVSSFLLRARDRATLAAWFPHTARYGQRIAGPASGLVLLSGIGMMILGKLGNALWVHLGFAGIALSILYGVTVMRKQAMALVPLLSAPQPDDGRILAAGQRMLAGNAVYLLLMASVIVVMVLKPTL